MAAIRGAYHRLLEAYCSQLRRRPWTTQALTSAALWGAGDIVAQGVEHDGVVADDNGGSGSGSGGGGTPRDVRRVALVTLYGGAFVGPLGHGWYEFLDRITRRVWPAGSPRCIAAKIAADTIVFGPIHVASFFGLLGIAAGETSAVIGERFRDKFWPTLMAESVAWPAVQGLNFWKVPVQHQLLVVNVVSLADCTFLSWVKHQQDLGLWRQMLQGGPFGP